MAVLKTSRLIVLAGGDPRTNNGLERLDREIKRRTRVASNFSNEASLLRLAAVVLIEIDDEWQTEKRYLTKTTS